LHTGDLLVLQGLAPSAYNTNYPYSDVIVFHEPGNPGNLIVHRIVTVDDVNGTLFFRTKGDGNPVTRWPGVPSPDELDPWSLPGASGVAQDQVVGRVVLRVPWVGHFVLFMQSAFGIVVVVLVVILLLVVEFVLPEVRKKESVALSGSVEV
jgi:signal peptidase I